MAEKEQQSAHKLNARNLVLGFFVYFIAACTSSGILLLSAYALYLDKPLAAGIIGALVTLVLAILGYRAAKSK